jgi:hypothetical protein
MHGPTCIILTSLTPSSSHWPGAVLRHDARALPLQLVRPVVLTPLALRAFLLHRPASAVLRVATVVSKVLTATPRVTGVPGQRRARLHTGAYARRARWPCPPIAIGTPGSSNVTVFGA